jgi:elongation factor P
VGSDVLDPDLSRFLQDGMEVQVSLYEGTPVGCTLPKSVVLAVIEADAVVKGQTASSSYKPAIVEGGIRVMVPPHIAVGTKLVINIEDGTYMERAKD